MHVLLKMDPWRVHLPCQLARRQKHDGRSLCAIVKKYCSMSAMVISAAYSAACFWLCTVYIYIYVCVLDYISTI